LATAASSLSPDQRGCWDAQGYLLLRGFITTDVCDAMLARALEICRRSPGATGSTLALVPPDPRGRLLREPVFADVGHDDRVVDLVRDVLGPDVELIRSQVLVTQPGAYGQLWHQDSYHFPCDPDHQVGLWLAITEATLASGCLWILPGSHVEPVHEHLPDRRPESRTGDVEIVDHDTDGAVPVLMEPGDLLVFDSHLVHRSTDNHSWGPTAAVLYHYGTAGTVGHGRPDRDRTWSWTSPASTR
jgi:phytanoyl-CoA hydroxylase